VLPEARAQTKTLLSLFNELTFSIFDYKLRAIESKILKKNSQLQFKIYWFLKLNMKYSVLQNALVRP